MYTINVPLYIILQLYPKFPFDTNACKLNISLIVMKSISEVY